MTLMDRQSLTELLAECAHVHRVPGASIAIEHRGERVLASTGVLSAETQEPVHDAALFQIGSVTKVLTATLAMTLVDEGLLDLDAPVSEYLPGFRLLDVDHARAVTIKQLLSHTSGMDGDFMSDTGTGPDRLARYVDRCALLPSLHAPERGFSYCNAGFCVLGRIAERLTRQGFDEAMQALFERMGLTQSLSDLTLMPGRSLASAHVANPEDPTQHIRLPTLFSLPPSAAPAGATVMMSASDLLEFAAMHFKQGVATNGERILKPTTAAEMQSIHVEVPVPFRGISHWGLGWFLIEVQDRCIYGHDGATVGQMSFVRVDPATDTLVALNTNGGSGNDFMSDVFEATFNQLAQIDNPIGTYPESQCDDLTPYVGHYRNIGGDTTFVLEDDRLIRTALTRIDNIAMPAGPNELTPTGHHQFTWQPPGQLAAAPVSFLQIEDDQPAESVFAGLRISRRVTA